MSTTRRDSRRRPEALWSRAGKADAAMLEYTVADDRTWDARLLRWDVLGSLGHLEGLYASGLCSRRDRARLRGGLLAALDAVLRGRLRIGPGHEDVHSAVELWLTRRLGPVAGRIHTGRSRNDQVVCDLRLYTKERLLAIHEGACDLAAAMLRFAARHRGALWPGYTHQRRAMPSSGGLWAAAYAEGLLDVVEALPALWARIDRSPLGSAAGYGVPLPLRREAAARALGFRGLDRTAASVQLGRGKLEAAVLFWCCELGHDLSRLAADVILFSAEEYGWLRLPPDLATGSSIMPHKRNPDLFELTRARAARLDSDLAAVLQLKSKLPSGYHRDFQFLKEPLMRGMDGAEEMLGAMTNVVPRLEVDRARGMAALRGDVLSTDEVMRRVEGGTPFRTAYLEVAEALRRGETFTQPSASAILARRRSTGGVGNLGIPELRVRLRAARRWAASERGRFDRAINRLSRGRR